MYSYSDTILFYSADVTNKSEADIDYIFHETLIACDLLFMAADKSMFPLRGAMTVGELIDRDNVVISKEIIEAYHMEKKQNWCGCWISNRCIHSISKDSLNDHRGSNSMIEYDIPMKDNLCEHGYVYNWVKIRQGNNSGIINTMRANLHRDDVRAKYQNIIKFIEDIKAMAI